MCLILVQFGKLSAKRLSLQLEKRGELMSVVNINEVQRDQKPGYTVRRVKDAVEEVVEKRLLDYAQLIEQSRARSPGLHANINRVWIAAQNVSQTWTCVNPTVVCLGMLPATVEEYVWYEVARKLRIPTLIFNASPLSGFSFCVRHLDDYGTFETHPADKTGLKKIQSAFVTQSTAPGPSSVLLEIDAATSGLRPIINSYAFNPWKAIDSVRSRFAADVTINLACATKIANGPNNWTHQMFEQLENVEMIDSENTYAGCWDNFDGVVTVGGPIGEAAAKTGSPVFVLGNPWYQLLPNVRSFDTPSSQNQHFDPNAFEPLVRDVAWPIEFDQPNRSKTINAEVNIDQLAKCLIESGVLLEADERRRRHAA